MNKLTTKEFIDMAKEVHGDRYDYSLVEYKGLKFKVKIICNNCQSCFEQRVSNHLYLNRGCSLCNGGIKTTKDFFIKNSIKIHGNKYDYSLVVYKNSKTKVKIICNKHGVFEQTPSNHFRHGCYLCNRINPPKLNKVDFINKAKKVHGNLYDYSLVEYRNNNTKIKIICNKHGIFAQRPNDHIGANHGCPNCRISRGEERIKIFLEQNNIKFEPQKTFIGCADKRLLPFDFYLPVQNILIEYDGEQHFEPIKVMGGNDKLIDTQKKRFD